MGERASEKETTDYKFMLNHASSRLEMKNMFDIFCWESSNLFAPPVSNLFALLFDSF